MLRDLGCVSEPARKLRVLDLFSGIGGFSLGLERTGGFETVAFCEIEEFPRRVLAKHWPDVPQYHDVTELAGWIAEFDCQPNVICGGFPCQDISAAGNREGIDGIRSGLWGHYARLIRELRPDWVIVENVAALLVRGLDRVLGDLAEIGYDAWWDCVRASALGYPHERDRLWLVAYPAALRRDEGERSQERWRRLIRARIHGVPSPWAQAANNDEIRSGFVRIVDGLPDHAHRLGGLGNAIIPEFAELIGNAILQSISGRTESARHFDPAPRELVGTILPLGVVPAFFDDAELSGDLPEYAGAGLPNADLLARSVDPFHAAEVAKS